MTLKRVYKLIDHYVDHLNLYKYHMKTNPVVRRMILKDYHKIDSKLINVCRGKVNIFAKLYYIYILHIYDESNYEKHCEYLKKSLKILDLLDEGE